MFPRWLGPLIGVFMTLVTAGVIVWMVGVKAGIWKPASGGFWVF
jgi:hypothetical protein